MNPSTNSGSPSANPKNNLVINEINRGKKYLTLLEQRQPFLPTKFEEVNDELYKKLYPDFYVKKRIVPDYVPKYEDCRHVRRNVVNRDALNVEDHINLLAQPKCVTEKKVEKPYVVKRIVLGPSERIVELARPKKRHTLETCKRFGATMPKFCIENCYRNAQDVTFVPVHEAVYFMKMNKRKSLIEKQKLKFRMQRLQERVIEAKASKIHKFLRHLHSHLKTILLTPLTTPHAPEDCRTNKINKLIENELKKEFAQKRGPNNFFEAFLKQISEKLADWIMILLTGDCKDILKLDTKLTVNGAGTTQAAAGTTEVGFVTVEEVVETSQAAAGTSQADAGTSEADAGTSQADAGTSNADAGTSNADAGTSQADAGTSQADARTSQAAAATTEIVPVIVEVDEGTQEILETTEIDSVTVEEVTESTQ